MTVIPADPQALAAALGTGDVAAVILEPSGAAWGTVPLPGGFLGVARQLTEAAGALLVFDEVVTGFRWAPGGVQEVAGVRPDLTALGKILAGGMPAGAVCGRADLIARSAARDRPGPGGPSRHAQRAPGVGRRWRHHAWSGRRRGGPAPGGGQAASLRELLNEAFAKAGVAGCAYGESSAFHLLFGTPGPDSVTPRR